MNYINLFTSGSLKGYLSDIDRQIRKRFELIVIKMKNTQGIMEQLKAEILWSGLEEVV